MGIRYPDLVASCGAFVGNRRKTRRRRGFGDGIGREANVLASRFSRVTMPARRNRDVRRVSSARLGAKPGATRTTRSTQAADKRWRRNARPDALRAAVRRTKGLRWSASLLELLIEELYIDESIEALLGEHPLALPKRRYPEAIAVALILRHSWRADDLACIVERLGLNRGTSARWKSIADASRAVRRRA